MHTPTGIGSTLLRSRTDILRILGDFQDMVEIAGLDKGLQLTVEMNPLRASDPEALQLFAEFMEAVRQFNETAPDSRRKRIQFEVAVQSHVGKQLAFREGPRILFMAELVKATTDKERLYVTLRIIPTPGLDFFPRFPITEITKEGELTVSSNWEGFFCNEAMWFELNVPWALYLDVAALEHLKSQAAALASLPPKERMSVLSPSLMEDSIRDRSYAASCWVFGRSQKFVVVTQTSPPDSN